MLSQSSRRTMALVAAMVLVTAAPELARAATVPVRVRIIKGARQGPPAMDPRLADLRGQLARLVYARWEEVGEHRAAMTPGKPLSFPLPDGSTLELTLVGAHKDTVTFEIKVSEHRTRSRLTISKDQRIVHQVLDERKGEAYFATIRPWPS